MAISIVAPSGASPAQHHAGAHNALTLALLYLNRGDLPAACRKAVQAIDSITGLQNANEPDGSAGRLFRGGEKVRFNGETNCINHRIFTGQVGEVQFQCRDFGFVDGRQVDMPGLVYVLIKAPGQRKPRSVAFHHESLEVLHG